MISRKARKPHLLRNRSFHPQNPSKASLFGDAGNGLFIPNIMINIGNSRSINNFR